MIPPASIHDVVFMHICTNRNITNASNPTILRTSSSSIVIMGFTHFMKPRLLLVRSGVRLGRDPSRVANTIRAKPMLRAISNTATNTTNMKP